MDIQLILENNFVKYHPVCPKNSKRAFLGTASIKLNGKDAILFNVNQFESINLNLNSAHTKLDR